MNESLQSYLNQHRQLIYNYLDKYFAKEKYTIAPKLLEAMRYSLLGGGKYLRGIFVIASNTAVSCQTETKYLSSILPVAGGIECLHTMSLIHDDLPCMDDDDLRRGQPSCHRQYNEAIALLAGDTLLIEGRKLINQNNIKTQEVLNILLNSLGLNGMCAGQALDLEYTNNINNSHDVLNNIHNYKTMALLRACVIVGGTMADASSRQLMALDTYAKNIGLAFQIVDDILDVESSSEILGKSIGKDINQNKLTYPKILGLDKSKELATECIIRAKEALISERITYEPLLQLADYIITRKY